MSLTFQQFTWPKAGASLAMSMNHDQTWLNGILSWDKKQTSYSFLFPEFSQVKSHSLLSSFRLLVCCRMEHGVVVNVSESVTVSLDHIQITSDTVITIKIFWGNITTTTITQITHYLVSSDQWIDKWLHIISFSKPYDKLVKLLKCLSI